MSEGEVERASVWSEVLSGTIPPSTFLLHLDQGGNHDALFVTFLTCLLLIGSSCLAQRGATNLRGNNGDSSF